jgi:hypothetical protein
MRNFRPMQSALGIVSVAIAVCSCAWAQTAQDVAEPTAPKGQATVIAPTAASPVTETAPAALRGQGSAVSQNGKGLVMK